MSTESRQPPGAGIRARLLNKGAYQWYLGTIFGLVYQVFEVAYVWTSGGSLAIKLVATALLLVIYAGYVLIPPLIWPEPVRTRVIVLLLYWAATLVLLPIIGVYLVWVWPLVVAMIAFTWLPVRASLVLTAAIIVAQVVLSGAHHYANGTVFSPFVTATIAVSLFSVTRQIIANRELRDAQATIASLAAAEERSRLARDLHDVLGHSLTVVAVKSELAKRLVEIDPERAVAEITDIETLARTALADLRSAVTSYRVMDLDAELVAARTALEAAGITSHLPADGAAVEGELRTLFGWVLREGVTNVIRHSKATECWVELEPAALRIRDDGRGAAQSAETPAGNGLSGLRERAREVGAEVNTVGPDHGGFTLVARRVPA